jgi:hypothetical protein
MPAKPWVTLEYVARHVGESDDTADRWPEFSGLPAHQVRQLRKFKVADEGETGPRRRGE